MSAESSRPGHSGPMGQPDMDKLLDQIHKFLRTEKAGDGLDSADDLSEEEYLLEGEVLGGAPASFLPGGNPEVLARVGRLARAGSYAVQGLAILALLAAASAPWPSRLHLALALVMVLAGGLTGVILLLGVSARIGLLLDIEANTRRIAENKQKIAQLLERIWII